MEQFVFERFMQEIQQVKQLLVIIAKGVEPEAFGKDDKKSEVQQEKKE